MNMKKMRGVIDPLTLGFLLTIAIGGMGAATNAKIQKTTQVQANAQTQQASVQQQAQAAPAVTIAEK